MTSIRFNAVLKNRDEFQFVGTKVDLGPDPIPDAALLRKIFRSRP